MKTSREEIIRAAAFVWKVSFRTILKVSREPSSVEPRSVCMWAAYKYLSGKPSLSDIGAMFRVEPVHHATTLYAINRVTNQYNFEPDYKKRVDIFLEILKTGEFPKGNYEHVRNIRMIRGTARHIEAAQGQLDLLLNDKHNTYLDEIDQVRNRALTLAADLGERIARINQKRWKNVLTDENYSR